MAEEKDIESIINTAVKAAITAELGQYKVPKEQHYKDHLFLTEFREWTTNLKSSFWKSLVATIVPALLLLLVLGFIAWVSLKTAIGIGK